MTKDHFQRLTQKEYGSKVGTFMNCHLNAATADITSRPATFASQVWLPNTNAIPSASLNRDMQAVHECPSRGLNYRSCTELVFGSDGVGVAMCLLLHSAASGVAE